MATPTPDIPVTTEPVKDEKTMAHKSKRQQCWVARDLYYDCLKATTDRSKIIVSVTQWQILYQKNVQLQYFFRSKMLTEGF